MKFVLTSILCFTFGMGVFAQNFQPKASFTADINLPNEISSKVFRSYAQGIVSIVPGYQYTFDNSLSIGAGLKYTLFALRHDSKTHNMDGSMNSFGAFLKIGSEKYYGNIGVDYGVRIGYSSQIFKTNYSEVLKGEPYINDGGFVEPTLGISLQSTENSAFKLALSYTLHGFQFHPHQIGLNHFPGFSSEDSKGVMSYFSIGFGYVYYFGVGKE